VWKCFTTKSLEREWISDINILKYIKLLKKINFFKILFKYKNKQTQRFQSLSAVHTFTSTTRQKLHKVCLIVEDSQFTYQPFRVDVSLYGHHCPLSAINATRKQHRLLSILWLHSQECSCMALISTPSSSISINDDLHL
jgi:hypothetical protein